MKKAYNLLLPLYLSLTVIIVALDNIYPDSNYVRYLKYSIIISIFLTALMQKKKYREQWVLNIALFFVVIADFFMTFLDTVPDVQIDTTLYGMSFFLLAYISLIIVFHKNFRIGTKELLAAVPILAIFLYILIFLFLKYLQGTMLVAAVIFAFTLGYMAWSGICTLFRGYYKYSIAMFMALAGSLMLLSDIFVAYMRFHPDLIGTFVPWISSIIWGTYIPAWAFIASIIGKEDIYRW